MLFSLIASIVLCGVIGGLLGGMFSQSLITGSRMIKPWLEKYPLRFDPMFPVYNCTATLSLYFSGIPGGIFAPSQATGAGIGMDLAHWLPLAPVSFMVLIGMVAYFSGVIQAPITAMVIVLEMTANQNIIFPLMIIAFNASGMSSLVSPRSLYRVLAEGYIDADKAQKQANKEA